VGAAAPNFILGIFLVVIFAVQLHWLPAVGWAKGWTDWKPVILPTIVLGSLPAAYVARLTRASMIEVMNQDYVRTARAKGQVERIVLFRHAFRNALIPLYVPFGHGVFYALAAESAMQEKLQRLAPKIVRGVLVSGSVIAAFGFVILNDQWGLVWWIAAATLLVRSRNQLLLSTCFVYTILLEWIGTAIGNWHWAASVPFVGLHSANPPSGVGILYILLDLITVAISSFTPIYGWAGANRKWTSQSSG